MDTTTVKLETKVWLHIPQLDLKVPIEHEDIVGLAEKIIEMDVDRKVVERRIEELVKLFTERGYSVDELSAVVEKRVLLKPSDIEEEVVVRVYPSTLPQVYIENHAAGARLEYVRSTFTKERNELGSGLLRLVKPYFDFAFQLARARRREGGGD
jgi:uncharacterized protein YicC (UPF0701 family)